LICPLFTPVFAFPSPTERILIPGVLSTLLPAERKWLKTAHANVAAPTIAASTYVQRGAPVDSFDFGSLAFDGCDFLLILSLVPWQLMFVAPDWFLSHDPSCLHSPRGKFNTRDCESLPDS
jgi:hypothetical protein